MYWRLQEILKKGKHSEPPVSLVGQLLWREFFYTCGATVENFDKMEGKIVHNISLYLMELPALKNVNNCLNTNIYSYLGTSGGQRSNIYLNVAHFFNTSVN
jgi:hypothetical protein